MNIQVENFVKLISDKLSSWIENGVALLPNIVSAVFVTILFFVIAKILKKLSRNLLSKVSSNKAVDQIIQKIIFLSVFSIGIFLALGILNLDKTVTSLLAGAGVLGLALGFAFQEIASNFVSGILIAFTEPYQHGDIVEVDDHIGEVTAIKIRTTTLTTFNGLEVIIPNKTMFTNDFINYTTTPKRRIDLKVGVSYSDDLDKVEKVVKQALQDIPERIKHKDIEMHFEEFGASSINFIAMLWIDYPANKSFLKARHQMIVNIKKAFDENNISIPFPIRTLDIADATAKKLHPRTENQSDDEKSKQH